MIIIIKIKALFIFTKIYLPYTQFNYLLTLFPLQLYTVYSQEPVTLSFHIIDITVIQPFPVPFYS